ncbi:unnamed protein product [Echinostoma caproni]|uniref:PHB domain-containing protein n=1 Tax=Echinostoma caproni TaxID=27848 RepID=A0A183A4W7_9TREM|nr:unnamed protein product [Echinostoma caproni]
MHKTDEVCSVNGAYNQTVVPVNRVHSGHTANLPIGTSVNEHSEVEFSEIPVGSLSHSVDDNNSRNTPQVNVTNSTLVTGSRLSRYENNNGTQNPPNISTIGTAVNNNNSSTTIGPRSELETNNCAIPCVESENKRATTKPRVSFDEDSNTTEYTEDLPRNYEDVVTLHVPTKENLWHSCRGSGRNRRKRRRRIRWFCKSRQSAASTWSSWWRGRSDKTRKIPGEEEMDTKSNGNHLNSIYENEGEESKLTNNENSTSPLCNKPPSPPERLTSGPEYEFNRTNTGHNWEADANDKPGGDSENNSMVWTTNFLAALSILLIIVTFPFSLIYCIRIVAEYERAVVLRMGNLIPKGKGTKGPGLFFILPCIDSVRKVDLRTVTFAIPPQELLTRDSVTVSVDAVVYYRVLNPVASVLNIEDAARSTRLLAQTTIRNVLGTKDLAQILMDRDEISTSMQSSLDATTDAWGVKVERVEIKDVRLPIQLQRAMAAEAEAAREARAKVIAATGEQEAARSLKKAARVIATSPMAFQLRYLQTLCAISAEKNSTIFFPVPIDIMQHLGNFGSCGGYTPAASLRTVNGWVQNQIPPGKSITLSTKETVKGIDKEPTETQHIVSKPGDKESGRVAEVTDSSKEEVFWAHDDTDEHSDTV